MKINNVFTFMNNAYRLTHTKSNIRGVKYMFEYKKDQEDIVYKIKNDGAVFLLLNQKAHREEMLLANWSLMMSSQLGNEKYANVMIQLCADWLTLAERLGIAMRRLQGNTAYFIDVIDRENPDVEEIKVSSSQMLLQDKEQVERYPDDFCGALIACRNKCDERISLFKEVWEESDDESMKVFLKDMIHKVAKYKMRYQNILDSMGDHGEREFCDNYEDERAWALDSGNYFDPKVPLFHNDK